MLYSVMRACRSVVDRRTTEAKARCCWAEVGLFPKPLRNGQPGLTQMTIFLPGFVCSCAMSDSKASMDKRRRSSSP